MAFKAVHVINSEFGSFRVSTVVLFLFSRLSVFVCSDIQFDVIKNCNRKRFLSPDIYHFRSEITRLQNRNFND